MRSLITTVILLGTLQLYVQSCGPLLEYEYIDPTLVEIVEEYAALTSEFPAYKLNVVGQTTDLIGSGLFGECSYQHGIGYNQRDVWVVPKYHVDGPLTFKALMFHELAHCMHGLDHLDNTLIMDTDLENNEEFWQNNWDVAIQDLMQQLHKKFRNRTHVQIDLTNYEG